MPLLKKSGDDVPVTIPPPIESFTRERIVNAAMSLYASGGLDKVSMRAIGRELNVSQMMAYRHFKSKEDLFAEIRERVFDNFADYLEAALAMGDTPASRMVVYSYAYLEFGKQAPADYKFIFDSWSREQYQLVVRKEGHGALNRTRAFEVQLRVTADLLRLDLDDARVVEAAHVMWQSLHGLASLHIAKKLGFGLTIDDLVSPTLLALVTGLFPRFDEVSCIRKPRLRPVRGLISSGTEKGGDRVAKRGKARSPS
jgi:AcrR family transcriptional regulator